MTEPPGALDTETLEPTRRRLPRPQRVAFSRLGMVATAQYRATEAGVQILEGGGNAIDAAVAAAFALGVCEPAASGLGGQTMMLLHDAESHRTIALDGSSRAPHRAAPGLLGPKERRRGYRATTVPSTPAVLAYALQRYGRLDLRSILRPAVVLAEDGYQITELQRALTRRERRTLRAHSGRAILLREGKRTYPVGSTLRQPALAATLRRLGRRGIESFYTGRIARAIEADMIQNDGLIRRDDLAQIPWPIERRPVSCRFDNLRILTFPPPGAGRTLVEMLNILSNFSEQRRDPDTPEGAVLLASVIQKAFQDRRDRPWDPNFYAQVEEKRMVSPEYAGKAARRIRKRIARRGETTHLSVMDRDGNVVALTQSIERVFGSYEATPELGFLYNNYMSAFEHEDISHPYYLRPNAVPWASVAPTIVFRGRKPWLAIGSPGSERITSSILQVLLRLPRQSPYEAVDAPRLHCDLDGDVSMEASRMRDDIRLALLRRGFTITERDPYSFYLGCVQLVVRQRHGLAGVADPRRDGSAGGPRR
jgi:gamma-glutamyltranspeptidase/glutathione hydrolase